jgi:hypothetical protein
MASARCNISGGTTPLQRGLWNIAHFNRWSVLAKLKAECDRLTPGARKKRCPHSGMKRGFKALFYLQLSEANVIAVFPRIIPSSKFGRWGRLTDGEIMNNVRAFNFDDGM